MRDLAGPIGFEFIESAPKDGTWVKLRFRPGLGREDEVEAQWRQHEEMPAGGAWFDVHGYYVTPGPSFWQKARSR